jgi:fructose-1-phosphate kinase PfkB-like protein
MPFEQQLRYAAAAGAANAARADVARISPAEIQALVDGVEVVTIAD